MPEALAVGPVVLPVVRVAALLALVAGIAAAGRIARGRGLDGDAASATAEAVAVAFVLGARVGHVAAHPDAYAAAPWAAAYLWQPGFVAWAGVLAACGVLAYRVRRRPADRRRHHLAGVGAGAMVALATFAAFAGVARVASGPPALSVGDAVPDASFRALDGTPRSLRDLRGQPLVVNLWATWCPPCRREMPALQALHERYAGEGLEVVGISVGEGPATVGAFLEDTPVAYPLWLDPAGSGGGRPSTALHERLGGIGLPTTVFVDDSGVIRSVRVGALSRAALAAEARALTVP